MAAACGGDSSTGGAAGGQAMTAAGTGTAAAGTTAPATAGTTATGTAGAGTAAVGGAKPATAGTAAPTGAAGSSTGAAGAAPAGAAGSTGAAAGGGAMATAGTAAAAGASAGAAGGGPTAGTGAGAAGAASGGMGTLGGPLKYTSALMMGMTIPALNKCPMDVIGGGMGMNKSPALSWTGGPADTKSFAIVLFDTMYGALHWAIWDIPPTINMLPEGLPAGYELMNPMGAHQTAAMGPNPHQYFGPCSSGARAGTYEFRLYALNTAKLMGITESSAGPEAQKAIEAAKLESVVWSAKPGM